MSMVNRQRDACDPPLDRRVVGQRVGSVLWFASARSVPAMVRHD